MRTLFIIVSILVGLYMVLKRRRFDFFTIGYASALIYFLPAFFGFVGFPTQYQIVEDWPMYWKTYVVMTTVVAAIGVGTFLYDLLPHRTTLPFHLPGSSRTGEFAILLALAGFILSILTVGRMLLSPDKPLMLQSINRWFIFFELGSSIAVVVLIARKRYWLALVPGTLLLIDVYFGIRVSFALTLIAVMTMLLNRRGRERFAIRQFRFGVLGLVFIGVMLMYKTVYSAVKAGDWAVVFMRLRDSGSYVRGVTRSEPFITQTILNEVLVQNFKVGPEHFSSVLYQFVFFAPSLGAKYVSFNDLFQAQLFPGAIGWGMANNIWAEMWSSGGWPLLIAFIFVYVGMLWIGSELLRVENPEIRSISALLFSFWAFYIHRNDLFVEVSIFKQVLTVATLCVLPAMIFAAMVRVRRRLSEARA
jgi:hypothetical protein